MERTALEDSPHPYWMRCAKQSWRQMSSTSQERRRLHCHSGWNVSSLSPSIVPALNCSDALYLATRGSAKVLAREGELGLLEGGAVADFLLVDMNGE